LFTDQTTTGLINDKNDARSPFQIPWHKVIGASTIGNRGKLEQLLQNGGQNLKSALLSSLNLKRKDCRTKGRLRRRTQRNQKADPALLNN
jgi:hypothetical protein